MPGNETDLEVISNSFADVGHNENASPEFIVLILISSVCPGLIRNILVELYPRSALINNKSFWINFVVDYCMTILPAELVITVWNAHAHLVLMVTIGFTALLLCYKLRRQTDKHTFPTTPFLDAKTDIRPVISNFRSYINILTAFSILAVDFPIYPKIFYKSRMYGTSLMDAGLGFFVISNAVVSPEARGQVNTKSFRNVLIKVLTDIAPLVFLGVLRYMLLTSIGYHVSIYDYGVHWNFFFTLAVVKLGSAMAYRLIPSSIRMCLGPVVMGIHQCFLLQPDVHQFLLFGYDGTASRNGFIEANREGIVSSIGFLAMHFVGVELGAVLMKRRETVFEHIMVALFLVVVCCSSWILMELTSTVQPSIRKFANMAYFFFILGTCCVTLVLGLLVEIVSAFVKHHMPTTYTLGDDDHISNDKESNLLAAVNYNGLVFFLVANLLTGAINICMDTSSRSDSSAFLILNVYMFALSLLFKLLYKHKIRLKAILVKS